MNPNLKITVEESFELFIDTLSRLDENKLNLNDDDLSYQIFEELDSEYHSFLHECTVNRLIENGLLKSSLKVRILRLREEINKTIDKKNNVKLYREDKDWVRIRNEAKSIMKRINTDTNK
jgi:hypothetical protein